jgi:hypothetical protein
MINAGRVSFGANAALVGAAAGAVALISIGLFFTIGQPFGTINDVALLVMTAALVPMALASYELGGRTPLWPARASLALVTLAAAAWCLVQLAMVLGIVSFDYERAATGAFAAEASLQIVFGAWILGASLLAGPWLASVPRWLGVLAGAGTVATALGLLLGGVDHPLTWIGGLGYQLLWPLWAFLLARMFRGAARRRQPMT